ncbi:MAG: 3-carboxy-cis,cis-muconate cycloisomerase, partial [Gemmatimonadota bacterium]|nr:3-carboxy-cis,cis-muconate cycloisomerase [Gemmatimonadota bacterium]
MTDSLFGASLLAPLYLDREMVHAMSDEVLVRHMIDVEVRLGVAQANIGLIPREAAEEIERKARDWTPAVTALQAATEGNGVPVAGLARELRSQVGGSAAGWVHWGATSQDILDTARGLQLRAALDLIENGIRDLGSSLASQAVKHRSTVMTGRTLGQAAMPTTFGYKAASWLASLVENLDRLDDLRARLLVVQLGGAVGTLAAFGEHGPAVEADLARQLDLKVPPCPWHTRREAVAELAGWLSLLTGGLGKMGQDVILLAQSEIGELVEFNDPARGASSTMPHKHNPVVSPRLVVAARQNAALLSSVHHALLQEHERGTHGWHLEQLTLSPMLQYAAGALRNAATLIEGLVVRKDRMARNVTAT